ncbi:MAG: C4-dicarboxylate transporter DcuC [Candidatus Kapabacteria bacterium]|nr:C4-dicarboxylate transporter DcuC [Candidatus Kapabacteria bacterium]
MPHDLMLGIAVCVCAAAMFLIYRAYDVRLVLFGAAVVLGAVAGNPLGIFDTFAEVMGDGKIIGPICSAMGFAFVLRATGCDRNMVRLLLEPVRRVRMLIIPAAAAVGFLTNMAITSQTAAAAAVGPILVPLMLGARFHPAVIGATLVLGCSSGGNLFNPGEPDVVTIQQNTSAQTAHVIQTILVPELAAFAVIILVFAVITTRVRLPQQELPIEEEHTAPLSIIRALLPPLPVAMLFVCLPQFGMFQQVLPQYKDGLPVPHAMLISTIITLFIVRKDLSALTKQFFEGLGYGYVHVISLIITASCFIQGLKMTGVVAAVVGAVASSGAVGSIVSLYSTMALAVLSGSGTAPSVTFSKAVLPSLLASGVPLQHVVDMGALGAIGATLGRTMSPVAAIVLFAATLTHTTPQQIVRLTALPLVAGSAVALALILLL